MPRMIGGFLGVIPMWIYRSVRNLREENLRSSEA
jgi:hypothetical protein